ncbi:hypothetical protein [[Eubacterium] cellulosolvens]
MNLSKFHWLIMSSMSGIIALGLALYCIWLYPSPTVYGEQFIMNEWAPIPFIQFKPITLIFVFIFLFYASLLQHLENKLTVLRRDIRLFLLIIAFLMTVGSLYELFFNFTLWGALMSTTGVSNPDILINRFPNPETAVSLVYASKLVILIFSMSSYSVFFLHRLDMTLHFKSKTVN